MVIAPQRTDPPTVVVVGAGIVGTMHAVEACRRGMRVIHLERDALPSGASVRNLGLVWVSGRAAGGELAMALRARRGWADLAGACPGIGFAESGSLTLATSDDGVDALQSAALMSDAPQRGFDYLSGDEARRRFPALAAGVLGTLHCRLDATVEPRVAVGALQHWLGDAFSDRYRLELGVDVRDVGDGWVSDSRGRTHRGDLVVLCPGAVLDGPAAEIAAGAPLQRVSLQVLQTAPSSRAIGPVLANVDSVRYYPAFEGEPRQRLGPPDDITERWRTQLLAAQRADGSLTVGDTHMIGEPPPFDYDSEPEAWMLDRLSEVLADSPPPVVRRWTGLYSQHAAGAACLRLTPDPGLMLVTGLGGRGMTLSPAIASESLAPLATEVVPDDPKEVSA